METRAFFTTVHQKHLHLHPPWSNLQQIKVQFRLNGFMEISKNGHKCNVCAPNNSAKMSLWCRRWFFQMCVHDSDVLKGPKRLAGGVGGGHVAVVQGQHFPRPLVCGDVPAGRELRWQKQWWRRRRGEGRGRGGRSENPSLESNFMNLRVKDKSSWTRLTCITDPNNCLISAVAGWKSQRGSIGAKFMILNSCEQDKRSTYRTSTLVLGER